MPSRKKHSKSRRGCESCKQRRVKCDEQGWPDGPCAACVIRKTECTYSSASLATKPTSSKDRAAVTSPSQSNPMPWSLRSAYEKAIDQEASIPSNQDAYIPNRSESASVPTSLDISKPNTTIPNINWADRIQELQLMHYWSTRFYNASDFNGSKTLLAWKSTVTELMFKFDFVLDISFALSSVRLAMEERDGTVRAMHMGRALEYQTRAFTPFSDCLENLSPENCEGVFVFTALNMACSTVAGQLPTGDHDQVKPPWQSILHLYDAVNAMKDILQNYPSWLASTSFSEIYSFMQSGMPLKSTDFRRAWTQDGIDGIQESTRRLRGLTSRIAVEKHPVYSKAVARLDHYSTQNTENAVGWLANCGPAFFEDVKNEEPVALMILMHWGVLLNSMEAVWWAKYSGSRLVEHLSSVLPSRGSGQEWNNAIAWCQNQVAMDIPQSQQYPHKVPQRSGSQD